MPYNDYVKSILDTYKLNPERDFFKQSPLKGNYEEQYNRKINDYNNYKDLLNKSYNSTYNDLFKRYDNYKNNAYYQGLNLANAYRNQLERYGLQRGYEPTSSASLMQDVLANSYIGNQVNKMALKQEEEISNLNKALREQANAMQLKYENDLNNFKDKYISATQESLSNPQKAIDYLNNEKQPNKTYYDFAINSLDNYFNQVVKVVEERKKDNEKLEIMDKFLNMIRNEDLKSKYKEKFNNTLGKKWYKEKTENKNSPLNNYTNSNKDFNFGSDLGSGLGGFGGFGGFGVSEMIRQYQNANKNNIVDKEQINK